MKEYLVLILVIYNTHIFGFFISNLRLRCSVWKHLFNAKFRNTYPRSVCFLSSCVKFYHKQEVRCYVFTRSYVTGQSNPYPVDLNWPFIVRNDHNIQLDKYPFALHFKDALMYRSAKLPVISFCLCVKVDHKHDVLFVVVLTRSSDCHLSIIP